MTRFLPRHSFATLVRPGRLGATLAFLAAGLSLAPDEGRGQTPTCSKLIADMAAQQKMIGTFRTLDYQIRQHFLLEANAILSTYGKWNTIEGWGTTAAKFRDSKANFEQQALDIRREIGRSTAIDAEELQTLNGAVDSFLGLIETGGEIAKLIDDERVDDANQIYYEAARPSYIQVHGALYTLITTAERRVASMARTPCS